MKDPTFLERANAYLRLVGKSVKIKEYLGGGTDGEVWSTDEDTAIKVFRYDFGYRNERDAYQRLADFGVTEKIEGFWIPAMLGFDDELHVVEMDLMQHAPYIIDFAKVRIDRPPDFSLETQRDINERGREDFEENWPVVRSLMAALESYQIYYLDPRPGNIVFPPNPS